MATDSELKALTQQNGDLKTTYAKTRDQVRWLLSDSPDRKEDNGI
jgi:hypothetical protein